MRHRNSKHMALLRRVTIITALCASLFGAIHFLWKHQIIIIRPFTLDPSISSDAWLGFLGNIIASIIAMLGIIITITYENKKERKIRRLEVQPIIRLQCCELNEERQKCESSYSLDFVDPTAGEAEAENEQTLLLPDIRIMNIGLNAASDIALHFDMEACFSFSFNKLSVLKADKTDHISIDCNFPLAGLSGLPTMQAASAHQESLHAGVANAMATLARAERTEDIDRMETVYSAGGRITVNFLDIFGNRYEQSHSATLRVIEFSDGSLLPYFSISGAGKSISIK